LERFNPCSCCEKENDEKNKFQVRSCLIVSAAEIDQELSSAREKNKIKKTRFFWSGPPVQKHTVITRTTTRNYTGTTAFFTLG
jgi:hypothetical protein